MDNFGQPSRQHSSSSYRRRFDGGPVGRARKPSWSKLTMWCIYSASGLSCRRAKCARLEQRSLALCRQQLPYQYGGSPLQCAYIHPQIRSACPLARQRSTLTQARLLAVICKLGRSIMGNNGTHYYPL